MKRLYLTLMLIGVLSLSVSAQVAPTAFSAKAISTSQIDLVWTHNGVTVEKFVILRSTDNRSFSNLAEKEATARSHSDTKLQPGTKYYYRIQAEYKSKLSPTYASAEATTNSLPKPETPTGFEATTTSPTQIKLSWKSDKPTVLEYSKTANFSNVTRKSFEASSNTNTIDALDPATLYYFRLKKSYLESEILLESDWVTAQAKTQDASPDVPSGLSVTGKTTSTIGVRWNSVSGVEGYQIRQSDVQDFAKGVVSADLGADKITHTFDKLLSGHTYYIQIRAKNTINKTDYWSDWSGTVLATTDNTLPEAPANLKAVAKAPTQVEVTWDDQSTNETKFTISRSDQSSDGPWVGVGEVAANSKTFIDNGVLAGKTYYYQVCAVNSAGSACARFGKVATPLPVPETPGKLLVTLDGTNALLSWEDKTAYETGYEIERKDNNGAFSRIYTSGPFSGTGTFLDSKLTNGSMYCYRVRAVNSAGNSGYSNEACLTVLPKAPNAPTNVQLALISINQVDVSWTDGGGATAFEVQRAEGTGGFVELANVNAPLTTYQDRTVKTGKTYSYRINASNNGGSTLSESKSISIPAIPAAPTYTLTVLSSAQIRVDYLNNAGSNATFLELQYALDQNFTNGLSGQTLQVTGTTVTISSLQANTRYYFRLRASNNSVPSTPLASDWVYLEATTLPVKPTLPIAPTNLKLTGTPDGKQIAINWTDMSENETGFMIEYAGNAGFSNPTSVSVSTNTTNYTITDLQSCQTYYVRIAAVKGADYSPWNTGQIELKPVLPTKPISLTSTVVSSSQINLSWKYTTNTEESFELEFASNSSYLNSTKRELLKTSRSEMLVGLNSATTYWFRLKARNCAGDQGWVSDSAKTTEPSVITLAAPTALTAMAVSGTQINVGWQDNATNETGYELQYSTEAVFTTITQSYTLAAGVVRYSLIGLEPGITYYIRVRAVNGDAKSSWLTSSTTTLTVPLTPTNLVARLISGNQIELTWDAKGYSEIQLTLIRIRQNDAGAEIERTESIETITGTDLKRYLDQAITPTTNRCCYLIRAKNAVGYSNWTNEVCVSLPVSQTGLPAPTNLQFETGSPVYNQLNLKWNDASSTETGFEVWQSIDGQVIWRRVAELAANTTTYSDRGLRSGLLYHYRVRAVQSNLTSPWSNTIASPAPLVNASSSLPVEWIMYPNPVTEALWFSRLPLEPITMQIRNQAGSIVIEKTMSNASVQSVDVRSLPAGMYFIQLETRSHQYSTRFVKQ
ncbi:fibronectin type III domain-containing protein [Spirosoma aerolatum]|uniref:fibronectin type III domain-containing protein n=1 Tax=Spirosoma aerolatum TaxID=1211326 RepID=UPI0009ADE7EB|nr:fibronectin type III domain-containing protein [Spirosoma aerolatum]